MSRTIYWRVDGHVEAKNLQCESHPGSVPTTSELLTRLLDAANLARDDALKLQGDQGTIRFRHDDVEHVVTWHDFGADVLTLHRSEPQSDSAPFELPRPHDFPAHDHDMLLMVDGEHYLRPDEVNIAADYELLAYRWTLYTLDHELAGVIAWSARPTLPDGFDNLLGIAIHHVTVHGA